MIIGIIKIPTAEPIYNANLDISINIKRKLGFIIDSFSGALAGVVLFILISKFQYIFFDEVINITYAYAISIHALSLNLRSSVEAYYLLNRRNLFLLKFSTAENIVKLIILGFGIAKLSFINFYLSISAAHFLFTLIILVLNVIESNFFKERMKLSMQLIKNYYHNVKYNFLITTISVFPQYLDVQIINLNSSNENTALYAITKQFITIFNMITRSLTNVSFADFRELIKDKNIQKIKSYISSIRIKINYAYTIFTALIIIILYFYNLTILKQDYTIFLIITFICLLIAQFFSSNAWWARPLNIVFDPAFGLLIRFYLTICYFLILYFFTSQFAVLGVPLSIAIYQIILYYVWKILLLKRVKNTFDNENK